MPINEGYMQLFWYASVFLSLLFVILTFNCSRKSNVLSLENEKKEQKLLLTSIDEIVKDIDNKYNQILEKKVAGQHTLSRLKETLHDMHQPLLFIEVGLLPPTFKFDDSEALKEKIKLCHIEQFGVISRGNATTSYSDWEWFVVVN